MDKTIPIVSIRINKIQAIRLIREWIPQASLISTKQAVEALFEQPNDALSFYVEKTCDLGHVHSSFVTARAAMLMEKVEGPTR